MKKAKLVLLSLLLLMIALSAAAGGTGIWTVWSGNGRAALDADSAPPVAAPGRQFSEPATVLVLGAGLVFLGFYAKLKRAK